MSLLGCHCYSRGPLPKIPWTTHARTMMMTMGCSRNHRHCHCHCPWLSFVFRLATTTCGFHFAPNFRLEARSDYVMPRFTIEFLLGFELVSATSKHGVHCNTKPGTAGIRLLLSMIINARYWRVALAGLPLHCRHGSGGSGCLAKMAKIFE